MHLNMTIIHECYMLYRLLLSNLCKKPPLYMQTRAALISTCFLPSRSTLASFHIALWIFSKVYFGPKAKKKKQDKIPGNNKPVIRCHNFGSIRLESSLFKTDQNKNDYTTQQLSLYTYSERRLIQFPSLPLLFSQISINFNYCRYNAHK